MTLRAPMQTTLSVDDPAAIRRCGLEWQESLEKSKLIVVHRDQVAVVDFSPLSLSAAPVAALLCEQISAKASASKQSFNRSILL